ncbi:vinculin isoform X2 [Lepeophtheirus salmonis]|uniref:vinculin isoform X2 n=1 Tax=Lepeophtheirus salmonis TaxID=72036 RepID=UPI003AF38132
MPPMYQTQTIASILEPVAQQVSKLIILHEEGEDGNAMPDLEKPVQAVSDAVANLTRVGKDTVNSSQVRKICRDSKRILDYLAISEVIETMEDLVQYVKDLSPCLAKICKDIDGRRNDLLNPYHRDSLAQNLEQIKTLAPILICSMKIFIQINGSDNKKGAEEAIENRNYLARRMTGEIAEIVRVLEDSAVSGEEGIQQTTSTNQNHSILSVYSPLPLKGKSVADLSFQELVKKILNDRSTPIDLKLLRRAVELGEKIGEGFDAGHVQADVLSLCNELKSSFGKDPMTIRKYLSDLENKIKEAVIDQIIQDMADIVTPIKLYCDSVNETNYQSLHRKREYADIRGQSLKIFANRLSKTANIVSYFDNETQDKRRAEHLRYLGHQIQNLTPQIINAGTIKINYPDNRAAEENFENLTNQFAEGIQNIRDICDETVNLNIFLRRTEEFIRRAIQNCESIIIHRDKGSSKVIIDNAAAAARLSNRLLLTLSREAENSEDPKLHSRVQSSGDRLKESLGPFLENSRVIATNLSALDRGFVAAWRSATAKFLEAIAGVSRIFDEFNDNIDHSSQIPNNHFSSNMVPEEEDVPPPRPPPPDPRTFSRAPPRLPIPHGCDTDDEEGLFSNEPAGNQPIHLAAHGLYQEIKQWDHSDNEIIAAAKKIAYLMAHLSELIKGGKGTKKELIACAKGLADQSEKITELAKELAKHCTDKKIRVNLLQVCEKIPTLGTQLRVLSTVKATMMGAKMDSEEDQQAMDILVFNAQKLNQAVKETVRAAESASIRVRSDAGFKLKWIRKQPWFQ